MTARRRPRVLHVDDDPAVRRTTSRILEGAGFLVHGAADGPEGLRTALEDRWSLVVLDVDLPGMSGFEVCERLRADRRTHATPVLHLSAARVDVRDRVRGLQGGADAYLVQPVAPEELVGTARALIDRGARRRSSAGGPAATARAIASAREEAVRAAAQLLRGPLSIMALHASSIAASVSDPVTRTRTRSVLEAHRTAAQILADLEELAWLQSTRAPLALEPRTPAAMVNAVASRAARVARDAGVSIAIASADEAPLRCDPSRLERALDAILRRAIGSSARGATLALGAMQTGGMVRFSVDGPLSMTQHARAQLEGDVWSTRQARRAPELVELGLARAIVAAHHGRITVGSGAGPLHVEIPVHPGAASST